MNADTGINWISYLRICVGMMGMRPVDFWNISPREMYAAMSGFRSFHSAERDEPMTKDSLEEMMELYPD